MGRTLRNFENKPLTQNNDIVGVYNARKNSFELFTDYYPYGMQHASARAEGVNRRKFGGKDYRGMRIFNGKNIYGSARDIGNIIAGYYCGLYDIKWIHARAVFDMYQSFVLKKIATEGISSQSAQLYGYSLG